jgi:hypothetical protein
MVLAAPLALRSFPDAFVNGRTALVTFPGASILIVILLFCALGGSIEELHDIQSGIGDTDSMEMRVEGKLAPCAYRKSDSAIAVMAKRTRFSIHTAVGAEERHVATLGAGNFFGERALIVDEPRNATCSAASDRVEVFALGKADFKQALDTSASFKDQIHTIYFQRAVFYGGHRKKVRRR